MSNINRKDTIYHYYEPKLHNNNLEDYAVLGWESKEAQELRFSALTALAECRNKSILDVGCGLGNLYGFLNHKNIPVQYTGVDIIQEMIERATQHYKTTFLCTDIFNNNVFSPDSFDVVYTSGLFNIQLGNNKNFLKQALSLFLSLAKEKVVFNLLHESSTDKEDTYWYTSEDQVEKILNELNIKNHRISYNRHYLNNDFTTSIVKEPSRVLCV